MPSPLELRTETAEQTRMVGAAIGELLREGDVVSLTGDLGAGKTTLVQGAARSLGISQPVLSPTFTLVREYHGRMRVYHLDVYRLERVQDVLDLGFDEMVDRQAALFIEWGDAVESLLPEDHLEVRLFLAGEEEESPPRRLTLTGRGSSWAQRWERLEQAMARWGPEGDRP